MKNNYLLYLIAIIALLLSNFSFGQSENYQNYKLDIRKDQIVQKLNSPTKVWTNGYWKINTNGHRVWEKGHWKFKKKTFQEKSQILRGKLNDKNKV